MYLRWWPINCSFFTLGVEAVNVTNLGSRAETNSQLIKLDTLCWHLLRRELMHRSWKLTVGIFQVSLQITCVTCSLYLWISRCCVVLANMLCPVVWQSVHQLCMKWHDSVFCDFCYVVVVCWRWHAWSLPIRAGRRPQQQKKSKKYTIVIFYDMTSYRSSQPFTGLKFATQVSFFNVCLLCVTLVQWCLMKNN